jgi:hypothetical protein
MEARPPIATVAAAAAVCVGLLIPGIAIAKSADTKVTIKGPNGSIQGKIFSARKSCLGGRKVVLYKLRGNGYDPADDKLIASDASERSGDHGEWSVGSLRVPHGNYYALARRAPGCRKAFSKVIALS